METKEPKFRDKKAMTTEQLRDPDYRLKQLQKQFENINPISCSRCHHCR